MPLTKISEFLLTCSTDSPLFPPTELYNETWLLRLVVNWFASQPRLREDVVEDTPHPVDIQSDVLATPELELAQALRLPEGGTWYSHARLPTVFGARHKGDLLAEGRTEVDAALGHFKIKPRTKLKLNADAQHLVILEAKLFSPLAPGIKHAPYYDQGARTVACIAETLQRADRYPVDMTRLGFYVLAPQRQLDRGVCAEYLNRESIRQKVKQRMRAYDDKKKKQWYTEWFEATMSQIAIEMISWETIISHIAALDSEAAPVFERFYDQCIAFYAD